jgi:hypothetical protein
VAFGLGLYKFVPEPCRAINATSISREARLVGSPPLRPDALTTLEDGSEVPLRRPSLPAPMTA